MTKPRHFEQMLAEFKRVGVDPDTFSAVLAVRSEDALRVLAEMPDGAGPAAFLALLRQRGFRPAGSTGTTPADGSPSVPVEVPHVAEGAPRSERSVEARDRTGGDASRDRTGT